MQAVQFYLGGILQSRFETDPSWPKLWHVLTRLELVHLGSRSDAPRSLADSKNFLQRKE